jgi:hypothetical protein
VFLHGLHVQGAIGGAVPRPVDDMEAHEKRFFEYLKYTPAGLSYGTKITNHRSHAASYLKMATSQDKIRQYFQLKKVITTTLWVDFVVGSIINIAQVKYDAASRANKNECRQSLATHRPHKKKFNS